MLSFGWLPLPVIPLSASQIVYYRTNRTMTVEPSSGNEIMNIPLYSGRWKDDPGIWLDAVDLAEATFKLMPGGKIGAAMLRFTGTTTLWLRAQRMANITYGGDGGKEWKPVVTVSPSTPSGPPEQATYRPNARQRAILDEWKKKMSVVECAECIKNHNNYIPGHNHVSELMR